MKTRGSIVFPNARWMTGRGHRTRKTIQAAQGVDMLRYFQPPLKIQLYKNLQKKGHLPKPKSVKKGTKMHLPVLWTLNILGRVCTTWGSHGAALEIRNPQSWVFYGILLRTSKIPPGRNVSWHHTSARLRKVCCLTSSFKTKPALISLYLTTPVEFYPVKRWNWGS